MVESSIASLYEEIQPDMWRLDAGFSPAFAAAQEQLLTAGDDARRHQVLAGWLQEHQPCLFGRIAVKWDLISYCILSDYDLQRSDEHVREKIQAARRAWTRLAFDGKRSGFIILAASQRLANANPDERLLAFALRLGSLYLMEPLEPNRIYMDEVFLELPGSERVTWRWNVGANYFGAAADTRWWQDHRIPGGIGFSMNSVGHLVKSTIVAGRMNELEASLGLPADRQAARSKVSSLPKALEMAMRTIDKAALTLSGRATELLPLPADLTKLPVHPCPVVLPDFLKDKNYCDYKGYYHTDVTVPAEYFRPDVERPAEVMPLHLDFTYLFRDDIDNPDFVTTASGRRVRDFQVSRVNPTESKAGGRPASASEVRRLRELRKL